MFICCGEGVGDAEGIGILCMCGSGDGLGEGIGIPGMFCIAGSCGDDAFGVGVGEGIGIPCGCWARIGAKISGSSNAVSTIRVTGWVKEASWDLVCDMSI
jgi:hypothetical protein